MRQGKVRVDADRRFEFRYCALEITLPLVGISQIVMRFGIIWVDTNSTSPP